jgi:integrase
MKYRLPDGRQVQKKLGPAWTERGRPPAGYFTKRLAEDALRSVLDQARRGTLPGMVRTGATFADAAAEYLRYIEHDRGRKPSTLRGYRSAIEAHLLPAFGALPVEDATTAAIDQWLAGFAGSVRSRNKLLIQRHGFLGRARRVYGLPGNATAGVEKFTQRPSGEIEVFSPEEVWALVRAATSEQDGAIFLTAAFTGLRMGELLALRWRDVDFAGSTIRVRASYYLGQLTTPKSGKVRAVPMAADVASALAQLGQREEWVGDEDLVFAGELGRYLDGSALRRRYKEALARAGLRPLRFHDLRHTFGTRMIAKADIRRVQEWMGHADIQTTMRYLHYAPHAEDAALVAEAFRTDGPDGRRSRSSALPRSSRRRAGEGPDRPGRGYREQSRRSAAPAGAGVGRASSHGAAGQLAAGAEGWDTA